VSYRRIDTGSVVDRLDPILVVAFGRENVYRDINSINPGENWLEALEAGIRRSDVLLAIQGHQWLGIRPDGTRRIDDRTDPIRNELALAFSRRTSVVPILVDGADMPAPEELPLNVMKIASRNAMLLRSELLEPDALKVVEAVRSQKKARHARTLLPRTGKRPEERLIGTWISQGVGDAQLEYTFHPDGTYEFAGVLRQERPAGSMLFESYQAGEYILNGKTLRLLPLRSTTTRRDPESPEGNYTDRLERMEISEPAWRLEGSGQGAVLIVANQFGNPVRYRPLSSGRLLS